MATALAGVSPAIHRDPSGSTLTAQASVTPVPYRDALDAFESSTTTTSTSTTSTTSPPEAPRSPQEPTPTTSPPERTTVPRASRTQPPADAGDPRTIGEAMAADAGWTGGQWDCLDRLWDRESGWDPHAGHPAGAYGIPQSLPGSKMATAGDDWLDNPATQVRWGLGYIGDRYGTPCAALSHSNATGWY